MARRIDSFAPVFQKLTERAVGRIAESSAGGEPLWRIPCRTEGEAINVMMQMRQYWKALIAARERGEIPAGDPRERLAEEAPLLACRSMLGYKRTVEVVHRDQLGSARAIADALGTLGKSLSEETDVTPPQPKAGGSTTPAKSAQESLIDETFRGGGK